MSVSAKQPDGIVEVQFTIIDPGCYYSLDQVVKILAKADELGYSLEKGSYLECLTMQQIDLLVNQNKTDA